MSSIQSACNAQFNDGKYSELLGNIYIVANFSIYLFHIFGQIGPIVSDDVRHSSPQEYAAIEGDGVFAVCVHHGTAIAESQIWTETVHFHFGFGHAVFVWSHPVRAPVFKLAEVDSHAAVFLESFVLVFGYIDL